jgi:hypothetical protein
MDLDELLKTAEQATSLPPLPPGGIPKQKLPSWIRWPIRYLILPFVLLEVFTEKVARWIIPPPFKQIGQCKRRGNCCHYILLPEPKGLLAKTFLFWNTEIYGFYQREKELYEYEGKKIVVMGCRYLKANGSCSKHFFRPKICRSWPIIERFGRPRMLKGCGYQAKIKPSHAKKYPNLHILQEEETLPD